LYLGGNSVECTVKLVINNIVTYPSFEKEEGGRRKEKGERMRDEG
jgi:hypothetical protein